MLFLRGAHANGMSSAQLFADDMLSPTMKSVCRLTWVHHKGDVAGRCGLIPPYRECCRFGVYAEIVGLKVRSFLGIIRRFSLLVAMFCGRVWLKGLWGYVLDSGASLKHECL
jgi:hypothetical protein